MLAPNGSRAVIVHFTHVRLAGQMGLSQMTKVSGSESCRAGRLKFHDDAEGKVAGG